MAGGYPVAPPKLERVMPKMLENYERRHGVSELQLASSALLRKAHTRRVAWLW
jgi:hypothetical protein